MRKAVKRKARTTCWSMSSFNDVNEINKMAEDYLVNPDAIEDGLWTDSDRDKWLRICRALKEAGKTTSFYYKKGEEIIGAKKLAELLDE